MRQTTIQRPLRPRSARSQTFCAFILLAATGTAANFGSSTARASAPQNPVATIPASIAVDDPPIFPLTQVKRGLRGYGYTVFASADGPERFEFEVLGVMRGYLGPGEDLIIAQLHGAKIERTGVIAGMSGSPVYVDGKLVGAVGYRFGNFTKDPIAGITPIERMLTAKKPSLLSATRSRKTSPASGRRTASSRHVSSRHASSSQAPMTSWGRAEPIAIPVAVSGVHPVVLEGFAALLDERGFGPRMSVGGRSLGGGNVAGTNNGRSAAGQSARGRSAGGRGKARPFYASGPIAGMMADGDISMSGIGTVTWVKGKRFLAFGHPFQGTGRSVMPVSNAEILTTVASSASSWKMGQATVPVGRLTDDRLHAIAGTMGDFPKTIDVRYVLDLSGPRVSADAKQVVKLTVIRDGFDSVLFIAIGLANALLNRVGAERGGTVDLTGQVRLSSGDVIELHDRAALDGSAAIFIQLAIGVLGELASVVDSGLKEIEIDSVMIEIKHREEVQRARLVSILPLTSLVAGKSARVTIGFKPHQADLVEQTIEIKVPRGLKSGEWRLQAADPRQAWRLLNEGGHIPQATDWESLLHARTMMPRAGTTTLFLVGDSKGVRLDGNGLPTLPPSLTGLLEGGGGLRGSVVESRVIQVGSVHSRGLITGQSKTKVWIGRPK